jgi:Uma2 family endonuclease
MVEPMSNPAPTQELVSEEEYLAADAASDDFRLEYIAGHIFALAGATKRHVLIAGNIFARFHAATEQRGCRVYQSDVRLRIGADMRFYPDIIVACAGDFGGEDPIEETSPTILVEVLSESTAHRDVGVKLAAYRQIPTLRMYLIVSQSERRVEVHSRAAGGALWEHHVVTGSGEIPVPALETSLSLDQIYARLER